MGVDPEKGGIEMKIHLNVKVDTETKKICQWRSYSEVGLLLLSEEGELEVYKTDLKREPALIFCNMDN